MTVSLKPHIVAFIDLLGFSSMVQHDCETPSGEQQYIESLYEAHNRTKQLSKDFKGLQVTQFSDSAVLAIPYSEENFTKLLNIVSDFQFELLKYGILCRGGISYGKHFGTGDFLFSKALIDAYNLESKIASTPRIIVSKELLDLVYPLSELDPKNHLLKENDGLFFVDYFKERNQEESWELLSKTLEQGLSTNPSIRSKQLWLIDYYNHTHPEYAYMQNPKFE